MDRKWIEKSPKLPGPQNFSEVNEHVDVFLDIFIRYANQTFSRRGL